tara:strand:- start:2202 stop:2465 length:264 start_codon:yes stop_codon:yes gene_type:complete
MREIKVKAINQRHQSMVNRSISWLEKYDKANSQRDLASDSNEKDFDDDCANWRKYDRLCEKTWDKYLECLSELPSREVKNIESSKFY